MDKDFLTELAAYVAIPSISADSEYTKECLNAAQWLSAKLRRMGFKSRLVSTGVGGKPLVMATRKSAAKKAPHLVVYGHYDVQPADPLTLWKTKPFEVVQKGGRVFGRGTADNKGPLLALLRGLEAASKKNQKLGTVPSLNITCLIEGEEEAACSHLPQILEKIKKKIGHVDAVVLSDTASESARQLCLTSGVRGILALEVHLRGLKQDLHSGNGGPVPNAIRELARVLGGLYNAQGWVNIPHFYDGMVPATKAELLDMKRALSPKAFAKEIGARGYYPLDKHGPFEVNRFFPSLEINGITGGYQGAGSKTIVPATASAKITCRIAAGQDPEKLKTYVVEAIKKSVDEKLFSLEVKLEGVPMPAYGLPLANPKVAGDVFARALRLAGESCRIVTGNNARYLREGGSIPILASFKKSLKADSIMLGLFTETSHLHSPNENVSIKLLENGARVWELFFARMGA